MSFFCFDVSDLLSDLEGSNMLSDLSGCSLVIVISRLFGNDDMVPELGIVDLQDP